MTGYRCSRGQRQRVAGFYPHRPTVLSSCLPALPSREGTPHRRPRSTARWALVPLQQRSTALSEPPSPLAPRRSPAPLLLGGGRASMEKGRGGAARLIPQPLCTLSLQRESSGPDPQEGQGEDKLRWDGLAKSKARLPCQDSSHRAETQCLDYQESNFALPCVQDSGTSCLSPSAHHCCNVGVV